MVGHNKSDGHTSCTLKCNHYFVWATLHAAEAHADKLCRGTDVPPLSLANTRQGLSRRATIQSGTSTGYKLASVALSWAARLTSLSCERPEHGSSLSASCSVVVVGLPDLS